MYDNMRQIYRNAELKYRIAQYGEKLILVQVSVNGKWKLIIEFRNCDDSKHNFDLAPLESYLDSRIVNKYNICKTRDEAITKIKNFVKWVEDGSELFHQPPTYEYIR